MDLFLFAEASAIACYGSDMFSYRVLDLLSLNHIFSSSEDFSLLNTCCQAF